MSWGADEVVMNGDEPLVCAAISWRAWTCSALVNSSRQLVDAHMAGPLNSKTQACVWQLDCIVGIVRVQGCGSFGFHKPFALTGISQNGGVGCVRSSPAGCHPLGAAGVLSGNVLMSDC